MYRANSPPRLSQMIDLAAVGLAEETYAQLDSMYRNAGRVKASEKAAWLGLELSPAAQAELDSYKDYITAYSREDTVKIDTTGGELTLHIPSAKLKEWHEYRNNRPLSARIDLSGLGVSPVAHAQLDSMFQNRQPLKLSQRVDLAALGLSPGRPSPTRLHRRRTEFFYSARSSRTIRPRQAKIARASALLVSGRRVDGWNQARL